MLYCKNKKFVKLIDFGLAKFTHKTPELDGIKGTPYFMSPEVIRGEKYDKRTDLWSMGVITYLLLSGSMPFRGNDVNDLDDKILNCDYNFENEVWREISREAKKFIEALIEPNQERRMTCEQALRHPWIVNNQIHLTDEEKA